MARIERGLPLPERVDAISVRQVLTLIAEKETETRHVLDLRRW